MYITKTKHLLLFKEIMAVRCKNYMKYIHYVGKMHKLWMWNQVVCVYTAVTMILTIQTGATSKLQNKNTINKMCAGAH
jgi:hypothetical protein